VKSFLCSRNAHPKKDLVRRPQSKTSHTLAWLGDELGEEKLGRKERAARCPLLARRTEEGMEPDDLLCSRNARPRKTLARVDGTSRRASGRAGEKVRAVGDHLARPQGED